MDYFSMNRATILKRIQEERKKCGLTQEALAAKLNCDPKTISDIESGRRNPSLKMFINICYVLGADINYVVFGTIESVRTSD
jgi:DNA-binding XRE family transcriptional regulator